MVNHKKILIIDDEAPIRKALNHLFSKRNYQVLQAVNGQEGMEKIQSEQPDVVISDIMMPKIDGKTLCEMTDKFKDERSFLTIIMTSRISQEDKKWVQKMRTTKFVMKPFSPKKVLQEVESYLSDNQGHDKD